MYYLNFCFLTLLITQVLSTPYLPQYYIGELNGAVQWAYPLDKCVPYTIGGYMTASCNFDDTYVDITYYSDSACTTMVSKTNYSHAQVNTTTGLHDFNCVGPVNYANINLYLGSCKATPIAAYGVVDVCYGFGLQSTTVSGVTETFLAYQKTQCNSTNAVLTTTVLEYPNTYDQYLGCRPNTYSYSVSGAVTVVQSTCSYFSTSSGIKIYANIGDCVYDGYTQFPQSADNSAEYSGTAVQTFTYDITLTPTDAADDMNDTLYLCDYTPTDFVDEISYYLFSGNEISVTTQCTTYPFDFHLTELSSLYVEVTVNILSEQFFNISNTSAIYCNDFLVHSFVSGYFGQYVSVDFSCTPMPPTTTAGSGSTVMTTTHTSGGKAQAINFVVLMICLVSMYIF